MALAGGLSAGVALLLIGGLHGYWAEGGRWPGRTDDELAEMVIGPGMAPPPKGASWVVAALLVGGAVLVLFAGFGSGAWIVRVGTVSVAAVLALRGLAGLVWSAVIRRASTFARLDRRYYSPLCLVVALSALVALTG